MRTRCKKLLYSRKRYVMFKMTDTFNMIICIFSIIYGRISIVHSMVKVDLPELKLHFCFLNISYFYIRGRLLLSRAYCHVAADKLTTANGRTFTSSSASLSGQSR